jgi:capsular exopolysaccharide synthesis family protein
LGRLRARRASEELPNGDLSARLITVENPTSAASEAYRAMRTNLVYSVADPKPRVILLTSPGSKEGKTTTCANLGVVLAQAGKSTLVLDCDLRNPALHQVFGLPNSRGVADVLAEKCGLQDVLQEPLPNLKVAPAGPIPHAPTDLLSSKNFAGLVHQARRSFDYVLIDSPHVLMSSFPGGPSADPIILAAQADGALLVLDARGTPREALRQTVGALRNVGARVLGTVVNQASGTR